MRLRGVIIIFLSIAMVEFHCSNIKILCLRYKRILNDNFLSVGENKEYVRKSKDEYVIVDHNYTLKKTLTNLHVSDLRSNYIFDAEFT
jgi:hypothetical protein